MQLAAVFPPMPTPFDAGEVDPGAIGANISRWMRTGVGGVVVLGTNGEAALLDEEESDAVVAAARDAVPPERTLIAGTGRESTRGSIDACRRAAALGADAVLVRTPAFFKSSMTADALHTFYTAVADASPVPVLLYNYPGLVGVNLSPDTVARLAEHPNVAGIKETSTDAAQFGAYADRVPSRFTILSGSAPGAYAAFAMGAAGAILAVACVAPALCVRMFDAFRAGDHEEARLLQRRLTPLAQLVTSGHGVPGLKAAMDLAGYAGGDPRPPLGPVSSGGLESIRAELTRIQEYL